MGDYDGEKLKEYREVSSLRGRKVTHVSFDGKTVNVSYDAGGADGSISFKL